MQRKIIGTIVIYLLCLSQSLADKLPNGIFFNHCSTDGIHCVALGVIKTTTKLQQHSIDQKDKVVGYYSHDSQQSWQPAEIFDAEANLPPQTQLNSMKCTADVQRCVVAGRQADRLAGTQKYILYSTQNGGKHWKYIHSNDFIINHEVVISLNDVTCDVTGTYCVAVGSTTGSGDDGIPGAQVNLILSTNNGGDSWNQASVSSPNQWNNLIKVNYNECDKIFRVTGYQHGAGIDAITNYYSKDMGNSWTPGTLLHKHR